jgi:hypothetical protein
MKTMLQRLLHLAIIAVAHVLMFTALERLLPGFSYTRLGALVGFIVGVSLSQAVFWWLFVNYLSRLPVWLYPFLTILLNGQIIFLVGAFLPGIFIQDVPTALWILAALTTVNTLVSGLLALDEEAWFDRYVTRSLVRRHAVTPPCTTPGFLFLEIDGLSKPLLERALAQGEMPTLARWLADGSYRLTGWETDFSSQTGAMQSGILLGDHFDIPAYRWWDRARGRLVMSGDPRDAQSLEAQLSSGRGLCAEGGASRGNMFSGDASESLLTFSTLLDRRRGRGPGFYFYLVNPYIIARVITRFTVEVVKEWVQALAQRLRRDPYRVSSRNFGYAFLRGFMSPVLQDLSTYIVISDLLRGLPASYVLYAGYDDIAHFAGMDSREAFHALQDIDRYFARIGRALAYAPRPYHLVVLSDHGQSRGRTFQARHGQTLEALVKSLLQSDAELVGSLDTNEAWDNLNALLNESLNVSTRTAKLLRHLMAPRLRDGAVDLSPERGVAAALEAQGRAGRVIVLASGCVGLIYFPAAAARLTLEQLADAHPQLLPGLVGHPEVGFVLVQSSHYGPIVLGKSGVHYLGDGVIDGVDPLLGYGRRAADHLRRQSSYPNCPDVLVNSAYDPASGEISAFENQLCHHGGLGGLQNQPFLLYPAALPPPDAIIGARALYGVRRAWRDVAQAPPTPPTA